MKGNGWQKCMTKWCWDTSRIPTCRVSWQSGYIHVYNWNEKTQKEQNRRTNLNVKNVNKVLFTLLELTVSHGECYLLPLRAHLQTLQEHTHLNLDLAPIVRNSNIPRQILACKLEIWWKANGSLPSVFPHLFTPPQQCFLVWWIQ